MIVSIILRMIRIGLDSQMRHGLFMLQRILGKVSALALEAGNIVKNRSSVTIDFL